MKSLITLCFGLLISITSFTQLFPGNQGKELEQNIKMLESQLSFEQTKIDLTKKQINEYSTSFSSDKEYIEKLNKDLIKLNSSLLKARMALTGQKAKYEIYKKNHSNK